MIGGIPGWTLQALIGSFPHSGTSGCPTPTPALKSGAACGLVAGLTSPLDAATVFGLTVIRFALIERRESAMCGQPPKFMEFNCNFDPGLPQDRLDLRPPVYRHSLDPDPLGSEIHQRFTGPDLTPPAYVHALDPNPGYSILKQRFSEDLTRRPIDVHPLDPDPTSTLFRHLDLEL